MNADELVKFLNTLRNFVSPYWKSRIEQVIVQMNGKVKKGVSDF